MPPVCPADFLVVESVRFPAGAYQLEGELAYLDGAAPTGLVAIAGPHPGLGGTMHNNVVRGLGDSLAWHNLVTLRFNYRGVGGSEGPPGDRVARLSQFWQSSHAREEGDYAEDMRAATAFLGSVVVAPHPLALVGYSFGCSLLPQTAPDPDMPLILIAPTIGMHDYAPYASLKNPKLVLAATGDFATDIAELGRWFDRLPPPRRLVVQPLDSHFFRGHEEWLVQTIHDFLSGVGKCSS
jgi:alpha/beta superfamily hydrolase